MSKKLDEDINELLISKKRLHALDRANILDTPKEKAYEDIAAQVCDELSVPISMVSIVDMNRQFLKSQQGMPDPFASSRELPLSHTFCQHVVHKGEVVSVNDMRSEPVFFEHPAVKDFNVQAYLGAPVTYEGEIIGTVCVIDFKPRQWNQDDIDNLKRHAQSVQDEIKERNGD